MIKYVTCTIKHPSLRSLLSSVQRRTDGQLTARDNDRKASVANEKKWMPLIRTVLCAAISVVCFVLAASSGIVAPLNANSDRLVQYVFRTALIGIAVFASWILYHIDWRKLIVNAYNVPDPPFNPDERSLAELQRSVSITSHGIDTKGLLAFIELLINPARYRIRVAETIDLTERRILQQVSVELALPSTVLSAKHLYLPVLMPLKGELLDNFRLCEAGGTSLPNLSYEETTRLAAVGLTYLLAADREADHETIAVDEIVLLGPVARRGTINPDDAAKEIDERLKALKSKVSDDTLERLRAYLTILSLAYPVVVVVPTTAAIAGRLLIKYERSIIPVAERQGPEGKLRLALGLRPHQVAVPVDLAFTAASYHLRINGPPDKFVIRQYLRCRHCGQLVRRNWQGRTPTSQPPTNKCKHSDKVDALATRNSHFRLRQRRGQSYVHLYMRGYANRNDRLRDFEFLARFKEVPPGSLGGAVATALVTTLLICVTGYLCTHNNGTTYSDLPALILALPVAAASWLGISEDTGKLVGSSLLGRVSLIASGLLSMCAIIIYLILAPKYAEINSRKHIGLYMDDIAGWRDFSVLGTYNWLWIGLMGVSFLCLAYVSFRFAVRLTYYNYLRRKPDFGMTEYGS